MTTNTESPAALPKEPEQMYVIKLIAPARLVGTIMELMEGTGVMCKAELLGQRRSKKRRSPLRARVGPGKQEVTRAMRIVLELVRHRTVPFHFTSIIPDAVRHGMKQGTVGACLSRLGALGYVEKVRPGPKGYWRSTATQQGAA